MKPVKKMITILFQVSPRILKGFFVLFLIFTSSYASYSQKVQLREFRAAVIKIDITPDSPQHLGGYQARVSTGVRDRIFHRIVALDDGITQFFLVSTDVVSFSPSEYDKVAEQLRIQLGIEPKNFWWAATHTHSAPKIGSPGLGPIFREDRYKHDIDTGYTAFVERKLIEGIREVRQKLSPARLGVGWGFSSANINRRAKDVDGKAGLGMEPDGPVDRRIGVLKIEKEDGSPLAIIANYPIHGTVQGGGNLEISGDVPGIVSEYVEQKMGAPLLFINGAAGNIAPIYSQSEHPRAARQLSQFRVLLGDKIIDACQRIPTSTKSVTLKPGALTVETPRKPDLKWPSDVKYTRTTNTGLNLVQIPVRFLKINEDIAIWSAPVELFCEISNEIRNRSPFPYTFYFGYTNGWFGYLLTEDEYKYGGYEPTVSPFTPRAARDLIDAVMTHISGEMRIPNTDSK